MARIRTIKPEFFTSEDIVSLTPLARLFYVSLWCEADREGRLSWKTKTLKMRYFPADDCDIDELAGELLDAGLIEIYEDEGKQYAFIPSFEKHQIINNRESASVLPGPKMSKKGNSTSSCANPTREKDASGTRDEFAHEQLTDASGTRGDATEGKEGKERKEGNARAAGVGFAEFWIAYPRKVSKGQAEKAFAKLNPDEHLLGTILAAVQRAKTRDGWRKDGGQFIPYPASWLNARGWEDEDLMPSDTGHNGSCGTSSIFAGVE